MYTYSTTAFAGLFNSLMPDGKAVFAVGYEVGDEPAAPVDKAFPRQKGMLPPNGKRATAVMVGLSTVALSLVPEAGRHIGHALVFR